MLFSVGAGNNFSGGAFHLLPSAGISGPFRSLKPVIVAAKDIKSAGIAKYLFARKFGRLLVVLPRAKAGQSL